jgi:hypothetical protein
LSSDSTFVNPNFAKRSAIPDLLPESTLQHVPTGVNRDSQGSLEVRV